MKCETVLDQIENTEEPWDFLVIAGGATGLGVAGAKVVWAMREEMARNAEDVLSQRTRAVLLGARASIEAAPRVAEFTARELKRDRHWRKKTVQNFCRPPVSEQTDNQPIVLAHQLARRCSSNFT